MTDDDLFDSACRNAGMRVTDCMDGPLAFRKAFMDAIAAAHARGVREGIEMAAQLVETHTEGNHAGVHTVMPKRGLGRNSITGHAYSAAIRALAAPETPP